MSEEAVKIQQLRERIESALRLKALVESNAWKKDMEPLLARKKYECWAQRAWHPSSDIKDPAHKGMVDAYYDGMEEGIDIPVKMILQAIRDGVEAEKKLKEIEEKKR